jgi:hypothetical protein
MIIFHVEIHILTNHTHILILICSSNNGTLLLLCLKKTKFTESWKMSMKIQVSDTEKFHFIKQYENSTYYQYTVRCLSEYWWGLDWEIGFIDHFNTWLMTKLNHSEITDFHILQITTYAKSFQSAFTSHFPVTDLNNGDFSASVHRLSLLFTDFLTPLLQLTNF